jgi:hypothetical protein
MLRKIALSTVLALAVAFVGTNIAKARSAQVTPKAPTPKGFCWPPGMPC